MIDATLSLVPLLVGTMLILRWRSRRRTGVLVAGVVLSLAGIGAAVANIPSAVDCWNTRV